MRLLGIGSFRGVIMAKIKLTKSAIDAAHPQAQAVELRDTMVPGLLCKITPSGRTVFLIQYRTKAGESRHTALGHEGGMTVATATTPQQERPAPGRRSGEPA